MDEASEFTRRPVIKEIEIDGNERFSEEEILSYLNIGETSWWAWTGLTPTIYYSRGYLRKDVERIEELYRSFGYYDARVIGTRVEPLEPESTKDNEVRIVIVLEEGQPVEFVHVELSWAGAPPRDEVRKEVAQRAVVAGEVLEVQELNRSVSRMTNALERHGHAFASVRERPVVRPAEHEARVDYDIDPGPVCRIEEVVIRGLEGVPMDLVWEEIDEFPGQVYSPQRMTHIEDHVYGLAVFGTVTSTFERTQGEGGPCRLRVTVTVSENPFQTLRLGPGIAVEPKRWQGHGSARYTHTNLFGRLYRLSIDARAGYAVLPTPWNIKSHGPVIQFKPLVTKKGLLEKNLVWTVRPSYEMGIEQGYQYSTPSFRIGVSRFFWGFLRAETSYNLIYYDFFNQTPAFRQGRTVLGRDYKDPFLLSYQNLDLRVYLTDDIHDPRNGVIIGTQTDLGGTVFGGQFDYLKVRPYVKGYWQITRRVQLAGRVTAGMALHVGPPLSVPLLERYYLGGANTVRGFGYHRLSPRIESCDSEGSNCETIPVGGLTMFLHNFELRVEVMKNVLLAAFFDTGDVREGTLRFEPGRLNYVVGPGLRYDSPIGKLRLDVGVRLNQLGAYAGDGRVGVHFSLGEAF